MSSSAAVDWSGTPRKTLGSAPCGKLWCQTPDRGRQQGQAGAHRSPPRRGSRLPSRRLRSGRERPPRSRLSARQRPRSLLPSRRPPRSRLRSRPPRRPERRPVRAGRGAGSPENGVTSRSRVEETRFKLSPARAVAMRPSTCSNQKQSVENDGNSAHALHTRAHRRVAARCERKQGTGVGGALDSVMRYVGSNFFMQSLIFDKLVGRRVLRSVSFTPSSKRLTSHRSGGP